MQAVGKDPKDLARRPAVEVNSLVPRGEEVSDVAHGGFVSTAQGVERQRVELDVVVRADVRLALDMGLVDALQARRRGRVRAVMFTWADGSVEGNPRC